MLGFLLGDYYGLYLGDGIIWTARGLNTQSDECGIIYVLVPACSSCSSS